MGMIEIMQEREVRGRGEGERAKRDESRDGRLGREITRKEQRRERKCPEESRIYRERKREERERKKNIYKY